MTLIKRVLVVIALGSFALPSFAAPKKLPGESIVRFATLNASLGSTDPFNPQGLIDRLSVPGNTQAAAVAEIIQRTNPDVLLINEFDYDAAGLGVELFQENYLGVSQNGAAPVYYPYVYIAPSNTGIPSGKDLNNAAGVGTVPGTQEYADDALGFGRYPGEFGMAVLSKYPIKSPQIRTFQNFLWKDMPGNLIPPGFYSPDELAILPLSSKSHWDIPVQIPGARMIHILAAHPTPPVFDGAEDRNGRRNHDEIRFWADYVGCGSDRYIQDDEGKHFGLRGNGSFLILGDYNADPFDGDGVPGAIDQLLDCPFVNSSATPMSLGGPDRALAQGLDNLTHSGNPAYDTADFGETPFGPGNLRADYVLPSTRLTIENAGIFWPPAGDPLFYLTGAGFPAISSDHRLVWVDIRVR